LIRFPARALIALFLLFSLGCAQHPTPPASHAASSEHPSPELASLPPQWAAAFSKGDLNALMSLYDKEALMWGTSSSSVRKGSNAIRDYYTKLLKAFPGTRVSLEETTLRVYGEAAVSSGSYTMARVAREGGDSVTAARFTMVYARREGKWLIVDHHLSLAAR
jgi:uncharacterized protein (TIGR02246 family)